MPGRPAHTRLLEGRKGPRSTCADCRFCPAPPCFPPYPPALLQVCVPQLMALVLTYPERVTEHNVEKLKQRVLNGEWLGEGVGIGGGFGTSQCSGRQLQTTNCMHPSLLCPSLFCQFFVLCSPLLLTLPHSQAPHSGRVPTSSCSPRATRCS